MAVEPDYDYRPGSFGNHTLRNKTGDLEQMEHHYESQAREIIALIDVERERSNQIIHGLRRKIESLRGVISSEHAQFESEKLRADDLARTLDAERHRGDSLATMLKESRELVLQHEVEIDHLQRAAKRRKR